MRQWDRPRVRWVTYHGDGSVSESRYIPVSAQGQVSDGHGTCSFSGGGIFAASAARLPRRH